MALLSLIKSKFLLWGGAVLAVLLGVIKFMAVRNTTLKGQVKQARKQLQKNAEIDKIDSEIDSQTASRRVEARKALENDEIPEHLRNPRRR